MRVGISENSDLSGEELSGICGNSLISNVINVCDSVVVSEVIG